MSLKNGDLQEKQLSGPCGLVTKCTLRSSRWEEEGKEELRARPAPHRASYATLQTMGTHEKG